MTEPDDLDRLPKTARRVARLLVADGHPHPVQLLPDTARSAAEAASGLGCDVAQIAKSIVFRRAADDAAVVVIASGVNRVDESLVEQVCGPLGRADASFVKERTGYSIGGVSPFGLPDDVVLVLDRDLLLHDRLWCAAGHPHAVVECTPEALAALVDGDPVAIC
jgi:prolyl-tRNA editing enzyme YbaK/EbsC (Cys-tRNA(Pro) deacylase)